MKFYEAPYYQENCMKLFEKYKNKIQSILPKAKIEHIGSSSIPNAISKGDLDILIGVRVEYIESTIEKLKTLGFEEKEDTLRTNELCMLESLSTTEEVAFQVIANGSKFEFFLDFRDKLRNNPRLVTQYNELKKICVGLSPDDYRLKKARFIDYILKLNS